MPLRFLPPVYPESRRLSEGNPPPFQAFPLPASRTPKKSGGTRGAHGDFGKRNLLVRSTAGQWGVAAVLDWEFAAAGTPLTDLGHFLRYERESWPVAEPHFSDGYLEEGGKLPQNWRQLARLIDLTALSESLIRDDLPDTVVTELVELVHATVENRESEIP